MEACLKKKKNIAIVTSNRADYGLLYWLIREINFDPTLKLQLIVTGAHLDKKFGHTIQEIKKDKFPIAATIKQDLVPYYTKAFTSLKPDMLIVLGDRLEILTPCIAAVGLRIPITHIHGGEITEGVLDEQVRHAITKMAHVHFAATPNYQKNIIQMGENPKRVFYLGAPGLEHLKRSQLLSKKSLEKILNFQIRAQTILVTLHPETLQAASQSAIEPLLKVLQDLKLRAIFTSPNPDSGGLQILKAIQDFVSQHPQTSCFVPSLGHLKYLSLARCVDAVVGNSSSGIIEIPSLKIPTVNIGNRQKGRVMARSIVSCKPTYSDIKSALQKVLNRRFKENLKEGNPYNSPGLFSKKAIQILKNKLSSNNLLHKTFHTL
ncbi:MAG: UDP-N-acetylglucosamine 2-epimerase (hydrolyzing) [Deltaproteobacteria bacterium]|nr:MAG: UDP-N-acetylglucosamine 2-epimerase (hydrolyzing) [Deltaproteobacteria bacterium]